MLKKLTWQWLQFRERVENEGLSWALSAADIVGDKRKLEELQSNYALAVSELGIRRGRPKSITGARHKSPAVYRAEIAANAKIQKEVFAKQAHHSTEAIRFGLTIGFDAVDKGQLVYAPAMGDSSARLVRGPNAPKGKPWSQIMYAIHPVMNAIVKYAKARGDLLTRELSLKTREKEVIDEAAEILSMAGRLLTYRSILGKKAVNDMQQIQITAKRTRERRR